MHLGHALLGDRLQPQEQLLTSATSCGVKKFVIPAGVNARLATPPLLIRSYGTKQVLGILHIPGYVVVPEDDYVSFERGILRGNLGDWPLAQLAAIHYGNCAEIALARTSPRREQNPTRMVAPVK